MKLKFTVSPPSGRLVLLFLILFSTAAMQAQTIKMGLGTVRTLPLDFYGYDMSTTVRGGVSCVDPDLLSHLPKLKPKTLRYPAGSHANWWNWRVGWYVDSPYLPEKQQKLKKVPNRLEDFKGLLTATGASAILDLNLLTSDVRDQIAMLKHADSIGIAIKYVELGNEFYLEGEEEDDTLLLLLKYPTPDSYADTAQIWIDSIHKHFPDVKIGLQGVFDKNHQERRNLWNDAVILPVEREDAITMHYYFASHYPDDSESEADKLNVNMGDLANWFYQPYKAWGILRDRSLIKVPANEEIWITEYNFSDHERPTHGTWASGLYTALHGMQLLQDDRITHINLHGVDGQAVFGAYFFDTNGYKFGQDEEANYTPPANPPVTQAWGLNAYGHTMTMVGDAIEGKTKASKIDFTPTPQLSTVEIGKTYYYDGLFGYLFSDANKSQAIIINLTGQEQSLSTTVMFPQGGSYEMRSAGVLNLIAKASDVTIKSGTLAATLKLSPYSVTRISANTVPAPPPVVTIQVNGPTTICEGESVELNAGSGYYAYEWSNGATTQKTWVTETGNYWVHAYSVEGGYSAVDTVHITVNPLPKAPNLVPEGKKSFCEGGSVGLAPGPGYSETDVTYFWPLTGSQSPSITVNESGNYYVMVTNEFGCTAQSDAELITVYPLPQPVITSVGPSSACYDVDVTLSAPPGYINYQWSNGAWGQTKTFHESGTYNVEVKDDNGCWGVSNNKQVTIWEPPDPKITVVGPTTYCGGSTTSYLTTLSGYNYSWVKGNEDQPGANTQNYTPTASGTYKVIITDSHGCTKKSSTGVSITIKKTPVVSISISGGNNVCGSETRTLTADATNGNGWIYKWKKNGNIIAGATNKNYTTGAAGSYSCYVTNSDNCSKTSNTITLTNNCKEGDQSEQKDGWLNIYPNPSADELHVRLTMAEVESGVGTIEIRNMLGQILMASERPIEGFIVADDLTLDHSWPNGIYMLVVRLNNSVFYEPFVIRRL